MDPGSVPPCLQNMTQIEELLIAQACPIMTLYHKHGGQLGYSGHVLNLPQNIQQFINKLPVRVNDLPVLTITRQGAANTHSNFRVRREKVLNALQWLKHNNKYYKDIEIDLDSAQHLPVDGIPDDLVNLKLPQQLNTMKCKQVQKKIIANLSTQYKDTHVVAQHTASNRNKTKSNPHVDLATLKSVYLKLKLLLNTYQMEN